ncbi:GntR family transcriptional regulator [Limihaloglobus sulfuriphilus]|uniref:GntR family transcriptional regulator n=1 Tax=Limihaloglobus sulfuriphilus TaxID=1851148 RepID=UPI001C99483A|nr:GntR family transcriptional regulator [Limihaloglobus sulfuriphilus]
MQIDTHSGIPIYRQIMDQIRYQILAEILKPGDPLDSVRELARSLKVNPMTVSKAYAYLEMEGLVERQRGIGLFAAELKPEDKLSRHTQLLSELLEKAAADAALLGISREQFLTLAGKAASKLK